MLLGLIVLFVALALWDWWGSREWYRCLLPHQKPIIQYNPCFWGFNLEGNLRYDIENNIIQYHDGCSWRGLSDYRDEWWYIPLTNTYKHLGVKK